MSHNWSKVESHRKRLGLQCRRRRLGLRPKPSSASYLTVVEFHISLMLVTFESIEVQLMEEKHKHFGMVRMLEAMRDPVIVNFFTQ